MIVSGINSYQPAEIKSARDNRYVYGIVLEEIVNTAGGTIVLSSQPEFENNPVEGALVGSIINILV